MSARRQTQKPNPTSGGVVTACTRFNNKTWQEYQDWKAKNQQSYEQIYQRPLKCIYGSPREMSHKKMPPHAKILVIEMNNDENQIKGIGVIQNKTASEVYRTPPRPSSVTSVPDLPRPPRPSSVTSVSDITLSVPDLPQPPPRIVFNHLFSDRNYTRYIYIGNEYYATKEELERNHTADAQYINEQLATLVMKETSPSSPPTHPPQQTLFQSLERLLFKGAKHMKRGTGITLCSCSVAPSLRFSVAEQPRNSAIPQLRANAAQ
jgi:hypothetical protein